MISFYPGPSRVHDDVHKWVRDAQVAGILSMNHRSDDFMKLVREVATLLKQKLRIPQDYTAFFTSSATECWEILAQSVVRTNSVHIFNGAFGEKWFDYTRRLRPSANTRTFSPQEPIDPAKLLFTSGELICITQNETSNGTQVSNELIAQTRTINPDHLIAVDATSSMAGIKLEFASADIWFASVQKCFGLPAGLAVLVCSPRAMKKLSDIGEKAHYNSLTFMAAMMQKWQTPFTPNVMGIYLLMRSLKKMPVIGVTDKETVARFKKWEKFFGESKKLRLFIRNSAVRSRTVITVEADPMIISRVKQQARKKGFLLGEGYGALNDRTFRIANFPALRKSEIASFMRFLDDYL